LLFFFAGTFMSGFIVSYRPPQTAPGAGAWASPDLSGTGITISHSDVERISDGENYIALVDGYALGVSSQRLVVALLAKDDEFLRRLHGHYCALIIHRNGEMWGFCDRFGARTLYWQASEEDGVIVSSRWHRMPVYDRRPNDAALSEMLRYRWMTGQESLFTGISQLPQWRRVVFAPDGEISLLDARQQTDIPLRIAPGSFQEKLDETRVALTRALDEAARSYTKAAVLLSGGVDSSLLAALARSSFRKCLLVSIEFPGEENPELEIARAFAKTLGLEHLIVKFDSTRVEADWRALADAKGGQINFLSIAMRQMIEAIPEDYKLLIYGEAADILFGSDRYKQTQRMLLRKRYADLLPDFAARWLGRLPSARLRKLGRLRQADVRDVALRNFEIQYREPAAAIVRGLCKSNLEATYLHREIARSRSDSGLSGIVFRALMQDIAFRSTNPNHFRETELSATAFGKRLFSPFMSETVIDVARNLTLEQYYGSDHVKPILRELACEHYDRSLIYREKHGFDVPHLPWLQGPLAHLVEAAREERDLFDGSLLRDLDVTEHYSLFWSLISWQLVTEEALRHGHRVHDVQDDDDTFNLDMRDARRRWLLPEPTAALH
jgi:asparagine synthetase B (glutamine-hydrolysing)